MFRPRQPLPPVLAGHPLFTRLQVNESGNMESVIVDDSKIVLPDRSTTDIANLLAAGIDPKRVNTKILGAGSVVTDMSEETKTKTSTDKE